MGPKITSEGGAPLSSFLRSRREPILERWTQRVAALPSVAGLAPVEVLDHLPGLLDHVVSIVEDLERGEPLRPPGDDVTVHAIHRLEEGFPLDQVVREYAELRASILEDWAKGARQPGDALLLDRAIDEAVIVAVSRFSRLRERGLVALDRISRALASAKGLDALLSSLAAVLLDSAPSVDSVGIYLRDDGRLVLRAAVGLGAGTPGDEVALASDSAVARIAATGAPLEFRDASREETVPQALRDAEVRAFHGLPLVREGQVVGVAFVASRTAFSFAREDLLLLRSMVERATSGIVQFQLRLALDAHAATLDAFFGATPLGLILLDRELRVVRVNRTLRETRVFTTELVAGRPFLEAVDPAVAPRIEALLRLIRTTGAPILDQPARFLPSGGSDPPRDVLVSCFPVRTPDGEIVAYGAAVTDVTESTRSVRERSELLARETEARKQAEQSIAVLDATFDGSPIALGAFDRELRYTRVNPRLAALNGVPVAAHLGRRVEEVLRNPDARLNLLLRQVIETGEPIVEMDVSIAPPATPDDLRHWVVSIYPIRIGQGPVEGVGVAFVETTERWRAERALRESEERFRGVADNIPHFAWIADAAGRIEWCNRRALEFTGAAADEVLREGWMQFVHPDHVKRAASRYREAIDRGELWEDTFPIRSRDGGYRWFLSRAIPTRNPQSGALERWFGTNTDVTDDVLRRERARFLAEFAIETSSTLDRATLLDRVANVVVPRFTDWFCVWSIDEAQQVKPVVVRHFGPGDREGAGAAGHSPGEALRRSVERVLATGEPEFVPIVDDTFLRDRDTDDARHAGSPLHSWMAVPLRIGAANVGVMTLGMTSGRRTFSDSDLSFAVEFGRRLALALENARLHHEAQQAIRARDELLAVVSHDLRTPLTSLQMQAHLLSRRIDGWGDEHRGEALSKVETIERNIGQLGAMFEALLDVSRIQGGRLALSLEPVDLGAVVKEVAAKSEALVTESGGVLRVAIPDGPLLARIDRVRMEQVVTNLLSNAAKYGAGRPVEVEVARADDFAAIRVRDFGVGIDPAHRPLLFRRFERVGDQRAFKGTGLGLWITKRIVDALGGTIGVESELGKGSTFTVRIPLLPAPR